MKPFAKAVQPKWQAIHGLAAANLDRCAGTSNDPWAANSFAGDRAKGPKLCIWTEQQLRAEPFLANARRVLSVRSMAPDYADRILEFVRAADGLATLREAAVATGLGSAGIRAGIWLLGQGSLELHPLCDRIAPDAFVRPTNVGHVYSERKLAA